MLLNLITKLRNAEAKLAKKATATLFNGIRKQAVRFETTAHEEFLRRDDHIADAEYHSTAAQDAEGRALKAAGTAANLRKLLGE